MPSTRPVLALMAVAALAALPGCDREASRETEANPATVPAPAPAATETVLAVAARDPDLTTLVAALQTAGLAETLNSGGPFTLFAPNNAAFEKIPAARRDALARPEGRTELQSLLGYHIVPARLDSAGLVQRIQAAGGSLALTTMQGGVLTARVRADGAIELTDAAGGVSRVVEADMPASNGVIHAIDAAAAPG